MARRYGEAAKYSENKANEAKSKFQNAEKNGESNAEKWEHYRDYQEYNAKAKEYKENAEKIREKISHSSEANENGADVKQDNGNEDTEVQSPIQNKIDGLAREKEVSEELEKEYPSEKGYETVSETYLRDENGKIVRDPKTGEARRIDFVIVKDDNVIDSIEVTSKTADKTSQLAKESRIREAGGNYIKDSNGNLAEFLILFKRELKGESSKYESV